MEMTLLRLYPEPDAPIGVLSPEVAVDILWGAAVPADGLEHIRAGHGPTPTVIDLAMFHTGSAAEPVAATALRLCRRAIGSAPALAGWTATPIPHTNHHESARPEQVPLIDDILPARSVDHRLN